MHIALKHREDTIIYAVGDVHGYIEELCQALSWCSDDAASNNRKGIVVLLGDYIDRGPHSKQVLDLLIEGPKDGHMVWKPIKGNHDDMMSKIWFDPSHQEAAAWWEHGGQQTLQSYGWDPLVYPIPGSLDEWIPQAHAEFLRDLPMIVETEEIIFVHAGLRPNVPMQQQSQRDMLWIRGDFFRSSFDFGKTVVHGHSPDSQNPKDHGYRIGLDSGCFIGGKLSIAAFTSDSRMPRFCIVKKNGPIGVEEPLVKPIY